MGTSCLNSNELLPSPASAGSPIGMADMSAVKGFGAVTLAL